MNRAVTTATSEGVGAAKWCIPLVLALGLAFLAWSYWLKPQEPQPVENRVDTRSETVMAARFPDEIAAQVTSANASATTIFADATDAIGDVTDSKSALQAAKVLPKLTDRINQLNELTDAIPESQRRPILETITRLRGRLQKLIDTVL